MSDDKLYNRIEWFCAFILSYSIKITIIYMLVFYLPIRYDAIFLKFAVSLLLTSISYIICIKWFGKPIVFLMYFISIIFYVINISYYENFNAYLDITSYNILLSELHDVTEHGAVPITYHMLVPLFDIPLFILFIKNYSSIEKLVKQYRTSKLILTCGGMLSLFFVGMFIATPSVTHGANNIYARKVLNSIRYDILANNIYQIINSRTEEERIKSINYGQLLRLEKHGGHKPIIVMIQVESLDGNIIRYKHNGDYVAPYLRQLAYQNIYYPYTLVYRYAGGSSDTEIAVLNGIEPFEDFPMTYLKTYNYPNSLPKMMGKDRYNSFGFHGNNGRFYNRNYAYKMMGFSDFFAMHDMRLTEKGWGATDEDVFEYVCNKMMSQENATLYYIVTMSSHEPYNNVRNYYHTKKFEKVKSPILRRYFDSISYVDKVLSDFIPFVKNRYDNVYIIIYGDHTPYLANESSYKKSTIYFNDVSMEFVPLIIVHPDGISYLEKRKTVSLLDIKPTVLSLTGASKDNLCLGSNLLGNHVISRLIPYRGKYYSREELYQQIIHSGN
jgi:lipoteichoic acid synthase